MYHLSAFHNSSCARIKFIICTCFDNKLLIFLFFFKVYLPSVLRYVQNKKFSSELQTSVMKNVNTSSVNITFCCLVFFRRGFYQTIRRIIQPKATRCRNSSDTETCSNSKKYTGENVLEVITASYKTKLQNNMCFL